MELREMIIYSPALGGKQNQAYGFPVHENGLRKEAAFISAKKRRREASFASSRQTISE